MGIFLVRHTSRVVIYDRRAVIRLATGNVAPWVVRPGLGQDHSFSAQAQHLCSNKTFRDDEMKKK